MGGRLAVCAGEFFSTQRTSLEHRLREEKAGVGETVVEQGTGIWLDPSSKT